VKDAPSVSRVYTHQLLTRVGYKLVDDAWETHGRYTYVHEEEASTAYVRGLYRTLQPEGWTLDARKLRAFVQGRTRHEIELEPGGAEVTGHFLHLLKPGMCA
jgi:hypothetical protein